MDIKSLLSIGNQKELFGKLIEFLKNPFEFFRNNKDTEGELLDFATFITRLSVIINAIVGLILRQEATIALIIAVVVTILFARIIAWIGIFIASRILNFFVSIITEKDNLLAAKRIIAYGWVVSLIHPIPIVKFLSLFLVIAIHIIGISQQYRLSFFKSSIIAIIPLIIIGIFAYFLLGAEGIKIIFVRE